MRLHKLAMSKRPHSETPGVSVAHVQSWKQKYVVRIQPMYGVSTITFRPSVPFDVSSVDVSASARLATTGGLLAVGIDEWDGALGKVLATVVAAGASPAAGESSNPIRHQFPRPLPIDQTYTLRWYSASTGSQWAAYTAAGTDQLQVTLTFHRAP